MAISVFTGTLQLMDNAGDPLNGGSVTVYQANTTTPISLFSDTGLSSGAANPITLDAFGRHAMRYFSAQAYKVLIKNSSGTTLATIDNIDCGIPLGTGALAIANGGTGATNASTALSNLGGATTSQLASVAADVAALSGTLASTEKTHIATGTTGQRTSSPVAGDIRWNTSLGSSNEGTIEAYNGAGVWRYVSLAQPPLGAYRNLVIKTASTTTITVTADYVATYEATTGLAQTTAVNSTINCATTGADALDTGALAASKWYHIWVIAKPDGTTKCLASLSTSSPTMPAGYTYKARIGAIPTGAGSTLHGVWQFGRTAEYVVGLGATTITPNIANGVAGTFSSTSPTLAAVTVAGDGNVIPTTAIRIGLAGFSSWKAGTTASVQVAPTTSWGGANMGPTGSAGNMWPFYNGNNAISSTFWMTMQNATSIAWASNQTGGAISCIGWEDNI